MTQSTIEVLSQAKELLRAGQKQEARNLLNKYLKQNPQSEQGWWVMSFAVDNPVQQIQCLKKMLQINPDREKVRKKLEELTGEKQFAKQAVGQASSKGNAPHSPSKSKKTSSRRWIAPLLVFGIIIISLALYFGYRYYSDSRGYTQPQAISPQSSPTNQSAGLPPTWTKEAPTLTHTPLPTSTETPTPTGTPTPDPNATRTPVPESRVGTRAGMYPPDFILKDVVTGEEISIRDYTGQPVLIAFFASWCPYCKSDLPKVQEVYEEYKSQGFIVLGVGVGESESSARNFGSAQGLSFPIMADANRKVADDYLIPGFPFYYYIGKNGKIGFVNRGTIRMDNLLFQLKRP
ncbi:MAG: TlpA family protein disulfide reductase [Anaerolineales bacterium]|nr:TlpA family protein disulfide reductase [Anaerolineales bacterium]